MAKKRYTLYLSRPLARKFDLVAQQRNGAKSALVEEALQASLEPQQHPGLEEGLMRRFNELSRQLALLRSDAAATSETLALFVRFVLTITPPLADSEQAPARLVGQQRFDYLLGEVGRRIAENQRLATDILATIPRHQPDLFATSLEDATFKSSTAHHNGRAPGAANTQETGHG